MGHQKPRYASAARSDDDPPRSTPRPPDRSQDVGQGEPERAPGAAVVLIVEDTADTRELYALYFTAQGYRVVTAQDGEAGIAAALHHRPDVIIMDLSMPRLNGVTAIKRLRVDRRTRELPVILLTGYPHEAIHQGALQAGADTFLTKPCLPEDLEEHARRLIRRPPMSRSSDGEELCAECGSLIVAGEPRYRRQSGISCVNCHDAGRGA
jgi:DNA-binding response OmpR family regulator